MSWFFRSVNSSIGKKILMALTGISLIIFLVGHLVGNLTLFVNDGGETFNNYAKTLQSIPFIKVIELVLALVFLIHMLNGVYLWLNNKQARPVAYKFKKVSDGASLASRTMIQTGSITFIFLVVHLKQFWFDHNIAHKSGTLYDLVVSAFTNYYYAGFYILAMILLGVHLYHAFQSAFQTFGWNHSKYFPIIKSVGTIYSIVIAAAFASIPIYFLITGGN